MFNFKKIGGSIKLFEYHITILDESNAKNKEEEKDVKNMNNTDNERVTYINGNNLKAYIGRTTNSSLSRSKITYYSWQILTTNWTSSFST